MQQPDSLIDLKTLARRLSLSPKTIRNRLSAGKWPAPPIRLGRNLRWRESDVRALMAQGWNESTAGGGGNK